MAKSVFCRHVCVIQIIFIAVGILSAEVDGKLFNSLKSVAGSALRTVARAPSKLLDGTQSVTTKVAGTVRKVKLLKPLVDVTAGPVTGILGTTSRLLGKPVTQPPKVIFLYKRPIDKYSRTDVYKNAIKAVIGLALNNVIFHGAQMKGEIVWDLDNMPVLAKLKEKLEQINVPKTDVDAIIKVLACNGKRDPPKQIVPKVMGILKTPEGRYHKNGPVQEILWIAQHLKGFYKLNNKQKTD